MIATAMAVYQATENSIIDISSMTLAKELFDNRSYMSEDEFATKLFNYSVHLTALTATLVAGACLTEQETHDMLNAVAEIKAMELNTDEMD